VLASALTYGLLRGALELATEHARGRHQFGRPLAAFQAVQFRLAECLNLLEGIRLSVLDAAWRLSTGRPNGDKAAALCWLMTEDASKSIAAHCHQVFGALGFCTETGLVQLTAGARWLRLTVGRRSAVDEVCADRVEAASPSRVGAPASLVLAGYGDLRGG
jgi:alkylation response protein AidB-like acyl-CoA dehydrogenase